MSARERSARFSLGDTFHASPRGAERTPLRVLIVEDSADDALLIARELRRGGYEPLYERVDTPGAMNEALDRESWDVVISDYYMPRFRAPEALALLRRQGSDAPFVIVSGKVGEELAVEAMRTGAHDYIMKDNMTRLCATIKRGLEEAEVRRERERAEKALRQAEEKYRGIFENSTEGIFQSSTDGRFLTANPALALIFGYESPEELMADVSDIASQLYENPEDRAEFARLIRQRGTVSNFEAKIRRKDGNVIWISMNARSLYQDGVLVGYEGTVRDITVRREAEEKLRRSEERTRTVITNAPVVLFALDSEGVYTLSEGKGLEAMGLRPGQGVGRSIFETPWGSETESVAHIHRALTGEEFTSVDVSSALGLVFEVRWSPVRDSSGELTGVIGIATDITERKKAEEELRQSLDRLVALHEAGHILGSTLEPEEIGTRLLEIMRRISGFTAAVISLWRKNGHLDVWRSIGLENLGPKTRYAPEVKAALEASLEKETTRVFALGSSNAEPAVGLCLPLRVRERSLGILEVYGPEALAEKDTVEILESLATQAASALENARLYGELAERERRLQELVGKILVAQEEERRRVAYEVHDGLAQVAAAAHQHLQAFAQYYPPASREGREDLELVSKLVRQTVGEARRIIADLRPTALDDLGLEAAIRLQLEALRAEGWQIGYESTLDDERLPVPVETALFRVTQEALTNIVKHARTRRVTLTLDYLRGPRKTVRLSVRDYGVGFSPEAPAKASGPGERVGLSGMRERVALLEGDFRVASRPGAGTLIVAEIPLHEPLRGPAGDDIDGH